MCVSSHSLSEYCTTSSGGAALSSGDHLAYVARSKHSGPPVSVRRISQHRSHRNAVPTAAHHVSNTDGATENTQRRNKEYWTAARILHPSVALLV